MRAGARSRRPAETTASGNHPEDAAERRSALAGQAGLQDSLNGVVVAEVRRQGCHPDDLPKGYQAEARGQAGQRPILLALAVAPWPRPDRATPGRRDGTAGAVSKSEQTRSEPRTDRYHELAQRLASIPQVTYAAESRRHSYGD